MITDAKMVARAKRLAESINPDEVHPDLASRLAVFKRTVDDDERESVQYVHARSLVEFAAAYGVEEPKPAKKAAPRARSKG